MVWFVLFKVFLSFETFTIDVLVKVLQGRQGFARSCKFWIVLAHVQNLQEDMEEALKLKDEHIQF